MAQYVQKYVAVGRKRKEKKIHNKHKILHGSTQWPTSMGGSR